MITIIILQLDAARVQFYYHGICYNLCIIHNFVVRLCVKPFETILAKRDEALGKAKETDEATMLIHTTLLKNCRECAHDVLATDVNWIIGILSHKTTVPKGKCM